MKNVFKGIRPESCLFLKILGKKNITWDVFSDKNNKIYVEQKYILRKTLLERQNNQCVYCERIIEDGDSSKIEHFYPRSIYKNKIFDWDNLFLCCASNETCSDYKDGPKGKIIDVNEIFRPDDATVNISECFDCEKGELCPAQTIDCGNKIKVIKTIDKLNLNHTNLVSLRKTLDRQIMSYWDSQSFCAYLSKEEILEIFKDSGFESLKNRLIDRYFSK